MPEDTFPPQVGDIWRWEDPNEVDEWAEFEVIHVDDYAECVCSDTGTMNFTAGEEQRWRIVPSTIWGSNKGWILVNRKLN